MSNNFQKCLHRAKQLSSLNAFISLNEAHVSCEHNKAEGRLAGMVVAVKNTIHVAGIPNTAGTPALRNFVPTEDCPVVKLLKAEGAEILGTTNLHELGFGITSNNSLFGPVRNPYDVERFAGGSSGGSAAAVSARIVPVAIGGDTGGSVRLPSSLCGVIGFRPSLNRYSVQGTTPISVTRDTLGPMALEMKHITLLDSVMSERPEVKDSKPLENIRLGLAKKALLSDLDPETERVFEAAIEKISKAGVTIVEAELDERFREVHSKGFSIVHYETRPTVESYLKQYCSDVTFADLAGQCASPDVCAVFQSILKDCSGVTKEMYDEALSVHRPALVEFYKEYFKQHNVDALVFPTTILPASKIEGSVENVVHRGRSVPTFPSYIKNTDPGASAGLPGISIPIGLTSQGLPVGLELDGLPDHDDRLLSVAIAIEALFGKLPPPPVVESELS
ncbi:indoleacetamide hydrolase-like [Oscarella lobularis]|uniref:indoleacetamide hydrolase-like n=1 Tax=Oscarella lobularis TaxID=121494 RepID=UPI003314332F